MAQSPIKIAFIVCSTRTPRIAPSISTWVHNLLQTVLPPNIELTILDLSDYPLPISPTSLPIPAHQPLPLAQDVYSDPAVDTWSLAVRSFSAYVFLTPQYNWSFPASVKCAIDHLFHEWIGKPALIVSYGNRGGGKAAAQLRQVCNGCRMHRWDGVVELPIGEIGLGSGVLDGVAVEGWDGVGGKREEVLARGRELFELVEGMEKAKVKKVEV